MANRNGATVGVQPGIGRVDAQFVGAAKNLGRKGFVDLDDVHIVDAEARAGEGLLAGGYRAVAHDLWRNTGDRCGYNTGTGLNTGLFAGFARADDQGRGAIVDARGVAGSHHASFEQRAQAGQCLVGGLRPRMLIAVHADGWFFPALRDVNGHNLFIIEAIFQGSVVSGLALSGKLIHGVPAEVELPGNVVGGFGHGVGTEVGLNARVGEAGPDGTVKGTKVAAERAFALGHHKRCPAHAFSAAGDKQLALIAANRPGGVDDGCQARATQAVNGQAAGFNRKAGQQPGMAGQVTGVLAGLVGATGNNVFVGLKGKGVALNQRFDNAGQKVVRANPGQCAGVSTEGCS